MSQTTETVLQNHLSAAGKGVDAIMHDFAEDSVLITHQATYRGLAEIRQFYTALLEGLPEGFWNLYKLNRQVVVGDVAYILWDAKPWFAMATDTLVVREGKIRYQTFAVTTS